MKKRKVTVIFTLLISSVILFIACSKGDDDGGDTQQPPAIDEFKSNMLVNYADNIIIPNYSELNSELSILETSINTFLDAPNATNQASLKTVFTGAYLSFENVSLPYFGPAASLLLNSYVNTFPAATAKIEAGIQSGNYNFNQPVTSDSIQGFPTLDYLLFSDNATDKFSDPNSANRKKYVRDVLARMKTLVSNTYSQWNTTYRGTFVSSLKTDVGSSIGFLVNQFAYEMDAMKGPRIGWPFGKQSNGIVFADRCEGYYSGITRELAIANLTSLKNYYTGGSGNGIADYLVILKKEQLNNTVLAQFDVALTALNAIPQPMSAAFTNNPALVEEAYKQVQKLLTLIKTDVASATGVQITYMDNDGD